MCPHSLLTVFDHRLRRLAGFISTDVAFYSSRPSVYYSPGSRCVCVNVSFVVSEVDEDVITLTPEEFLSGLSLNQCGLQNGERQQCLLDGCPVHGTRVTKRNSIGY